MAKDYQLKGKNFCGLSCVDQESVIHPETCIENTLISDESNEPSSLKDWILKGVPTGDPYPDVPDICTSLLEWLTLYYSGEVSYILPTASTNTKGGIKVGQYLTINNDILSVDTTNFPVLYTLPVAGNPTLGGVRIFNEWLSTKSGQVGGINIKDGGTIFFDPRLGIVGKLHFNPLRYKEGTDIPDYDDFYIIPVDIIKEDDSSYGSKSPDDSVYNIIANIPFAILQGDWSQSDNTQSDYIKNKPNLATVATSGSYNDLINKPTIPTAPVQSNWNENNASSLAYIQNKPVLETIRTVEGPTDGWNLEPIASTIFTGNPVVNLTSENVELALTLLLSNKCPITNMTLYIPKLEKPVVLNEIDSPITELICYKSANSTDTYTDDGEGHFTFSFSDAVSKIQYFNNESTITLYITDYTLLSPSAI